MRHPTRPHAIRPLGAGLTLLAALAVLASAGGLAACASSPATPPSSQASAAAYPVTVGSVTLDKRPERIVSLSATATEMLFAIGAGGQVVAADQTSNYPPEAPDTDLSAYQPNAEAIAVYRPDLVVLSDDLDSIVAQLRTLSIPTVLMPAAKTLADSYTQIADLGTLTGHPAQAQALAQRLRADIDKLIADLPDRSRPLTFYYELDTAYYSVTSQTFIGSLLASIGLINIADTAGAGSAYPQLSAEAIVGADPDLIFLADTKCCDQSARTVAARAGWGAITAVRQGGVIELDDDVASRWGPRVVDLLRIITEAVAKSP